MNWLQKIAQLEKNWWKKWIHHFKNVTRHVFDKSLTMTTSFGQTKELTTSFGQSNITINFVVDAKEHLYYCRAKIELDRYIAHKLEYKQHQVSGVEDLEAEMTGSSCYILRDAGSGIGRGMGPVELLPQESTPLNIVNTFKSMIDADRDDEGDSEAFEPETPPAVVAPAPAPVPLAL